MSGNVQGYWNLKENKGELSKTPVSRSSKKKKAHNKRWTLFDIRKDQECYQEEKKEEEEEEVVVNLTNNFEILHENLDEAQKIITGTPHNAIADFIKKSLTYTATINFISPYETFVSEALTTKFYKYLQDCNYNGLVAYDELHLLNNNNWWTPEIDTPDYLEVLRRNLICPMENSTDNRGGSGETSFEIAEVEKILFDAVERMHQSHIGETTIQLR